MIAINDAAWNVAPSRVALFGCVHLPTHKLRFDQAQLVVKRLTEAGYIPIGFDHFAWLTDPPAIMPVAGEFRSLSRADRPTV